MWLKNESQYVNQRPQNCAEEQKVLNDSLKANVAVKWLSREQRGEQDTYIQ